MSGRRKAKGRGIREDRGAYRTLELTHQMAWNPRSEMGIRGGKPRRFILYDALEDLNSCPRPRPSTSIELSVGAFCTITVILKIRRTGRPFVQKRPGDGSSSSSTFCVGGGRRRPGRLYRTTEFHRYDGLLGWQNLEPEWTPGTFARNLVFSC